jgi:hypothetical protein
MSKEILCEVCVPNLGSLESMSDSYSSTRRYTTRYEGSATQPISFFCPFISSSTAIDGHWQYHHADKLTQQ